MDALSFSPAVLLQGPRQCGKTTLARTLLEPLGYVYINCDDPRNKEVAEDDVVGFVSRLPEKVILDEVQVVPHIFSQLKLEIDRRRVPGRFFLTGSSFVLSLPKLTDSLAGRIVYLRLRPLSQSEIAGKKSNFIDTLFGKGFSDIQHVESLSDQRDLFGNKVQAGQVQHDQLGIKLCEIVTKGGYPTALATNNVSKIKTWQKNNLDSAFKRDLVELIRIGDPALMKKMFTHAARCTSGLQNIKGMADAMNSNSPTAKRYLALLEQAFLLERLSSWHKRETKRLVKSPRLHVGDTGLGMLVAKCWPRSIEC